MKRFLVATLVAAMGGSVSAKADTQSLEDRVKALERRVQILEGQDSAPGSPAACLPHQTEPFRIPAKVYNEQVQNLPRLLSQARAVPYFRNGEDIGARLFAIKSNSLFALAGLCNGDILLELNGKPFTIVAGHQLFPEQPPSETVIRLERKDEVKEIRFRVMADS